MGVRVIAGRDESDHEVAVLYCSTTGWAFGPVFDEDEPEEIANQFLDWLNLNDGRDARVLTDREMEAKYYDFRVYRREKEEREAAAFEAAYFDEESQI